MPSPPRISTRTSRDRLEHWGLLVDALLTDHGPAGPYAAFARLRGAHPALSTRTGALILSRYDDCDAARRDRNLGKVDESLGFRLSEGPEELQRTAMRRFRRTMLSQPTRPRAVAPHRGRCVHPCHIDELRSSVIAQIELLLDKMSVRPHADIIADLALPLPVSVIGTMLGVPDDDRAAAAQLVRDLVAPLEPSADAAAVARAAVAEDRLTDYFTGLLSAKRRAPGDDLLSRLATARGDNAFDDDDECVVPRCCCLPRASRPRPISSVTGVAALRAHPEQMHLLRERPEIVGTAVEKLLRYDALVQTNGCTVLRPTTLASHDLTPGRAVLTLLGAANRDPDVFDDPDTLDLTPTGRPPLAFGAGILPQPASLGMPNTGRPPRRSCRPRSGGGGASRIARAERSGDRSVRQKHARDPPSGCRRRPCRVLAGDGGEPRRALTVAARSLRGPQAYLVPAAVDLITAPPRSTAPTSTYRSQDINRKLMFPTRPRSCR